MYTILFGIIASRKKITVFREYSARNTDSLNERVSAVKTGNGKHDNENDEEVTVARKKKEKPSCERG